MPFVVAVKTIAECLRTECNILGNKRMQSWSVEHRAFAVGTYLKNNDSVVATKRAFLRYVNIHRNDGVPSSNIVLLWVRNFRQTASAAKRKPPGRQPSDRTPENIERVRQAFVRIPQRSAIRNAIALTLWRLTTYIYIHIYMSYRTANLQTLHFKYLLNKYTC